MTVHKGVTSKILNGLLYGIRSIFVNGEEKPIRSRINFSGLTVVDDAENEWLELSVSPVTVSEDVPQPLGIATPGTTGEVADAGHVHEHGDQDGGTQHTVATSGEAGFMSAADKALLDTKTASATNNAICRRDSGGACAFTTVTADDVVATNVMATSVVADVVEGTSEVRGSFVYASNSTDVGVGLVYDAPVATPAEGSLMWSSNGQVRAWGERGMRHEVTCGDTATGATSKRILDRLGRHSGNTTGNKAVTTVLAADIPAGEFVGRITVDWVAYDVTGDSAAGGTLKATVKGTLDPTLTLSVLTSVNNQQIGTPDNVTTSIDTTTTKPQVLASGGDFVVQVSVLNTNEVRIAARVRDFLIVEH